MKTSVVRRFVKPLDRRTAVALALKMLAVVALILGAGARFHGRYVIALDRQEETSIPGRRLFLIDTKNTSIDRRLQKVVFEGRGLEPWFADGTRFVKFALGLPGDHVVVTLEGVWINGAKVLDELVLAEPLALSDVERDFTLGEGEYFVGGYHPRSYDSRYFGPIHREQIRGKGYAF